MKKLVASIVLMCIAMTLFSACGGSSADQDWKYIEAKKEMIVGITYYEPMNYLDESSNLIGFETEFTTAVCEILGITPKFQEINWTAKETELNAKNIDCIWNGMTIDAERAAAMSISKPYMKNKQVLIAKKDNADAMSSSVSGKSIVAEKTSAGETVATTNDFFKDANYTAVDAQSKALMEVLSGTADGCVVDYVYYVGRIVEGSDYSDLVIVEGVELGKEEEFGVAFRKGDTELTKKVNDAIDTLRSNGKLMEIATKYKVQDLIIQ